MSENTNVEAVEIQEEPVAAVEETVVLPQEPVVPAEPEKKKKVRKPRSVPMKILMGFIAFILCIVMFVVCVAGVAILNLRAVVSENGISQIITQMIAGTPAPSSSRPVLAAGADQIAVPSGTQDGMSGMLVDWAYEMLQEQLGEDAGLTKEQVQNFVENSTVKDFLAKKTAGLVEDFYSGDYKTTITTEEITTLIKENAPLLEEQFGLVISEQEIAMVEDALAESGILEPIQENGLMGFIEKEMMGTAPDVETDDTASSNGMQAAKEIMEIVRTVTSFETVAILGGIFLLLLLLLFFVTGRSFPATFADTGIVLTLVGLIFSAPAILCTTQPQLLMSILGDMAGGIAISIFGATAWVNYTVLGTGVALIVAAIVTKIVLCCRKKAAA